MNVNTVLKLDICYCECVLGMHSNRDCPAASCTIIPVSCRYDQLAGLIHSVINEVIQQLRKNVVFELVREPDFTLSSLLEEGCTVTCHVFRT